MRYSTAVEQGCSLLSTLLLSTFTFYPLHPSHVRPQGLRYHHRPVLLLVVFENRHQRPADRQAGAVQRVDELGFARAADLELDVRAPRLERFGVAAGRNLAILLLARAATLRRRRSWPWKSRRRPCRARRCGTAGRAASRLLRRSASSSRARRRTPPGRVIFTISTLSN